jgi:inosine-uridine nucleoside N-ribohydrolase
MAHKLILDTDIGTYYDDAFATLLAGLSPEIDFLGLTTV